MKRYLLYKINFFYLKINYWGFAVVTIFLLLSLRWFPGIYNKLYFNIYSTVTLLLSTVFIGKAVFHYSELKVNVFSMMFSCFFLWAVVVTTCSSVFYFPSNTGILLYIAYLFLLWVLSSFSDEYKNKLQVLLSIIVGLIILQYWLIWFINPDYYFQYGFLINKSLLANFLAVYLFLYLHERKINYFLFLMLGLIILTIITTGSRTAILALLLGGLVMLFQKLKSLTYAFRVGLVVVVSIVMLWLYYLRPDSVKGRVVLWNAFLSDTDAEAFFKGKGINYTGYKAQLFLEKYLGDASLQEQLLAGNTFSPMNEYIRILVENGVLGLGLFILALVVLCYHFFIRKQTALLAACIVFMICGFSSYPLYAPGIWFLVLFIGSYYKGKEWSIHLKRKTWVAAGVIVCSVFFFVVIRITIYNNALLQWYSLQNKEDYLYNEPYFVKRYDSLYTNLNRNPLFLTDYGIKLQELSRYEKSVEILNRSVDTEPTAERYMLLGYGYEQLHQYDAAESFYKKAIQTQPKLFRSRYFLFNLYRQLGKTDMAKQEATEILLFPVKISSAEVNVIKEEVMRYLME